MKIDRNAKLLRIFVGSSDKLHAVPVYEKIVEEARRAGLAGASVFRGTMGFGANSIIHSAKILAISEDLPMVIEIVDSKEKIDGFIPQVEAVFEEADSGGLITLEHAEIIQYARSRK